MKEKPNIRGIETFYSNSDASLLQVNGRTYYASNENELKDVVRAINKMLGNCRTPGRKVMNASIEVNYAINR